MHAWQRDEEGVRNVVAECLGKLAAVSPAAVHAQAHTRSAPPPHRAPSLGVRCSLSVHRVWHRRPHTPPLAALAAQVTPHLLELLPAPSAATRATVVSALRFALTEIGAAPLPPSTQAALLGALRCLADDDLRVRRAALLALNCAAHNKPSCLRDELPSLLPLLMKETTKRADLVHQVRNTAVYI